MTGLEDLVNYQHKIIIIGGGLIGSFIYKDAAMRCLNPVLIEMGDFGGETTSASTKLAHGGIRYLANLGDWGLVRESAKERIILMRIAPKQVSEMGFFYPIYDGRTDFPGVVSVVNSRIIPRLVRKPLQRSAVEIGLTIYDVMAYGLSGIKNLGRHGLDKSSELSDLLNPKGLFGIVAFRDGKFSDPQELAKLAISYGDRYGGNSFNHAEVTGFEKDNSGKVNGIIVNSEGQDYHLKGKVIINATGPWIDKVNSLYMDNGEDNLLLRVGGIHVVVKYFPSCEKLNGNALVIPATGYNGAKKILFAVPEEDYWILGTTETPLNPSQDVHDYKPTEAEIGNLLDDFKKVLHGFNLTQEDILKSYAGVRPLTKQESSLTKASRRDLFYYDKETGVISVTGKLTPARALAERVVDFAFDVLGYKKVKFSTATKPMYLN